MKILVIGSGGREHALAWKISQSPHLEKLFCAPGNPGTMSIAENVAIDSSDIQGLTDFAAREKIGLTVVGPELPLTMGIVDDFEERGLKIFGPDKKQQSSKEAKYLPSNLWNATKYQLPEPRSQSIQRRQERS